MVQVRTCSHMTDQFQWGQWCSSQLLVHDWTGGFE